MEKNKEIQLAWDFVEKTGVNIFLTGKAGTGKTTFLRELKTRSPKRMVVLAPTGIAAINAGGVTIHSFFQLPLSPYIPGASFSANGNKMYQFSNIKRNIIRTLDLIVIDEISMVRADLLDAVDSVMRRYRDRDKPFGGAQLLLIGDLQQLPPVVKENEWQMLKEYYDTPYFFSSTALKQSTYYTINLQTVYRQQDKAFIDILNNIRTCSLEQATFDALNRRYIPNFEPPKGSDFIRLTTHNRQAQSINDCELNRLDSEEYTYKAEVTGTFPETSYPADPDLTLKVGAQVMFIKNDQFGQYYNGMLGEVVLADEKELSVKSKETGGIINLSPTEWANSKYTLDPETREITEKIEGTFRQFPLRLAWAITIHKSQGMTFSHAFIDASHSFANGQAYVALSRCKSLEGMVLSQPLSYNAIISDRTIDEFTNRANANHPSNNDLSALEEAYIGQLLDELFNLRKLSEAIEMTERTLLEFYISKDSEIASEYEQLRNIIAEARIVAGKFANQYHSLIGKDNALLQERIRKGCEYFLNVLNPITTLIDKSFLNSKNQIAKERLSDRLTTLKDEVKLKFKLWEYESREDTIFTPSDYLHNKALAIIGETLGTKKEKSKKSEKKEKKVKEKKTPTAEITYNLYANGKTIDEIAAERGMTKETVIGHLATNIKQGKIDVKKLVPANHIKRISDCVAQYPKLVLLREIREKVGEDIPYKDIHLVLASIKPG